MQNHAIICLKYMLYYYQQVIKCAQNISLATIHSCTTKRVEVWRAIHLGLHVRMMTDHRHYFYRQYNIILPI